MDICPKCGMTLHHGTFVCPRCGASVPLAAPVQSTTAPLYAAPPAAPDPPQAAPVPSPADGPFYQAGRKPAPPAGALTTGGCLLCLFLFHLPLAGWIVALVFALGGTQSPARRDLARAQLLFWLLCIGLAAAVYLGFLAVASVPAPSAAIPHFYF